jgi:aspartate kinase
VNLVQYSCLEDKECEGKTVKTGVAQDPIRVHKFGGSSVRRALSLLVNIIATAHSKGEWPIVIVSALADVTNLLIKLYERSEEAEATFAEIVAIHLEWLKENSLPRDLLNEVLRTLEQNHVTHRDEVRASQATVVAYGERLAAIGVAAALRLRGVSAEAVDASGVWCGEEMISDIVLETGPEGANGADPLPTTQKHLREGFMALREKGHVPVYTGFIGSSEDGFVVTLGRGGSDQSACIVGAAVGANEIAIWTDVEGMMTGDPRIVKERARPLKALSYSLGEECASAGGKLPPRSLRAAVAAGIPVRMSSTFAPDASGTLIDRNGPVVEGHPDQLFSGPLAVLLLKKTVLITLHSASMSGTFGFVADASAVLKKYGIIIGLISTSEVEVSLTVQGDPKAIEAARLELEEFASVRIREEVALLTVIHTDIDAGDCVMIFEALKVGRIKPLAISMGTSRLALQVVIGIDVAEEAVCIVHERLFPVVS